MQYSLKGANDTRFYSQWMNDAMLSVRVRVWIADKQIEDFRTITLYYAVENNMYHQSPII